MKRRTQWIWHNMVGGAHLGRGNYTTLNNIYPAFTFEYL